MSKHCRIELFGGLRVIQGERTVTKFKLQKAASLLAFLALYRRRHSREVLAEQFWPEGAESHGSLRVALTELRSILEPAGTRAGSVLLADRQSVCLVPDAITTDVAEFRSLVSAARNMTDINERGRLLVAALDINPGELLQGFYEEWALAEQKRGEEERITALLELTDALRQTGEPGRATSYAQQAIVGNTSNEVLHCDLMRSFDAAGRPGDALTQFQVLTRILRSKGLTPSEAARELEKDIRKRNAAGGKGFFGREEETARLLQLLTLPAADQAGGSRLITLTGTGGCGKTRLAEEVKRQLKAEYGSATYFVPLADMADASLIADAILKAAKVDRAAAEAPLKQVVDLLNAKPSLLVLDNFEHILEDGVAVVLNLMNRVSPFTCVVTSRRPLGLRDAGEQEIPVDPLPTPLAADTAERRMRSPSVQLFLDRAKSANPRFKFSERTASDVAELCRKLEGIPLAIVLAAAHSKSQTPAQMLRRVSSSLEFLRVSRTDQTPRHRSMWAAITSSYEMLPEPTKSVLAHLSVFRGGCTSQSVAVICLQADGSMEDAESAGLDYLRQLMDHSLIYADAVNDEMRFYMLDTIREYASEKLNPEEGAHIRRLYANYFTGFAEQADEAIDGPDTEVWLKRMEAEIDNVRAALAWCVAERDGDAGLRLAAALWPFWEKRGYAREGLQWLEQTLAVPAPVRETTYRAKAHNAVATLAWQLNDLPKAQVNYEHGLDIYRRLVDAPGIQGTLNNLGILAWTRGDLTAAREYFSDNLDVYRSGQNDEGIAITLTNLGIIAFLDGDVTAAEDCFEESLTIKRRLQDEAGTASVLNNLGSLREHQQRHREADDLYLQGLNIYVRLGDNPNTAIMLHNTGNIAALRGQRTRAVTLHGAAQALRKAIDIPLAADEQDRLDIALNNLRKAMGSGAFEAAWSAGCAMSAEEAAAHARDAGSMI